MAKALIASQDCDNKEVAALGDKFVGVRYLPREADIIMQIRTVIRARHQRVQRGKPTSYMNLDDNFCEEILAGGQTLTRCKVL